MADKLEILFKQFNQLLSEIEAEANHRTVNNEKDRRTVAVALDTIEAMTNRIRQVAGNK